MYSLRELQIQCCNSSSTKNLNFFKPLYSHIRFNFINRQHWDMDHLHALHLDSRWRTRLKQISSPSAATVGDSVSVAGVAAQPYHLLAGSCPPSRFGPLLSQCPSQTSLQGLNKWFGSALIPCLFWIRSYWLGANWLTVHKPFFGKVITHKHAQNLPSP